jgi:hypothetical protein
MVARIRARHGAMTPGKYDKLVVLALQEVELCLRYVGDMETCKVSEKWQLADETLALGTGDCIPHSTKIYARNGLVTVGDLQVGTEVLSYDFVKRRFCYKKVSKIWEKGTLPVVKTRFRNGHELIITHNHPFWMRTDARTPKYVKTPLNEVDLSRWRTRRTPCVLKLPYDIRDVTSLDAELCFVIGHFVAEGWIEGSRVCTSGYDVDEIIPILERHNIPFSEGTNGGGVPIVTFLKSSFKETLRCFKKNSFDIHLPAWVFHLPEDKLQAFVDGHFLGDGHDVPAYGLNNPTLSKNWSTSSERFALDLNRIFLQLGKPVYFWKQEKHGGVGKKPIWRLRYKPSSAFCQPHNHKGLSEVSISFSEDAGTEQVRDFEVEGTHSFVFENGIIGHNCEDGAVLLYVLCAQLGVPEDRMFLWLGDSQHPQNSAITVGHCCLAYTPDNYPFQVAMLDWCYDFSPKHITELSGRPLYSLHGNEVSYHGMTGENIYQRTWFIFNSKSSYTKVRYVVDYE